MSVRDDEEVRIEREVSRAVRSMLTDLRRETIGSLDDLNVISASGHLVAAGGRGLPTLGMVYGWWTAQVDARVLTAVRRAFLAGRQAHGGRLTSLDAAEVWVALVRDRLVRGLEPPLPEAAFDKVRVALAQGAADGWDKRRLADRISATLSWDVPARYWRAEKERIDSQIDAILDPLGPPGTPARETARLNDPRVLALREARNEAIKAMEAEATYWQNRAMLIARTESTGAVSYGSLSALRDEGWTHKEWVASPGPRTRPEHAEASGQVVPIGEPFVVGGYSMQAPGDPSAPVEMVANCRCSVLGSDG